MAIKQSKGLCGDLKPEYKKTTNRITMSPKPNFYGELVYKVRWIFGNTDFSE